MEKCDPSENSKIEVPYPQRIPDVVPVDGRKNKAEEI
jgi:hypothetical protein